MLTVSAVPVMVPAPELVMMVQVWLVDQNELLSGARLPSESAMSAPLLSVMGPVLRI